MTVYNNPDEKVTERLKIYTKYKETAQISNIIKLKDISYVEGVFHKKGLFIRNEEITGYAYIVLENPNLIEVPLRELCELAYYNSAFLCTVKEGGILDAFRNSEMDKYEKKDVATLYSGVEYLTDSGYTEVEVMKNIVEELKAMRDINIGIFKDIDEYKENILSGKSFFNEELRDAVYQYYIKTLKLNYQKVKIIESYSKSLNTIQEIVGEKMSMFETKFLPKRDFGIVAPLRKLKYEVSYYTRVIETYEKLLLMSEEEYLDYVKELDIKRIEERFKLIRK